MILIGVRFAKVRIWTAEKRSKSEDLVNRRSMRLCVCVCGGRGRIKALFGCQNKESLI